MIVVHWYNVRTNVGIAVNGVQVNIILRVSCAWLSLAFSACIEGEPGNKAIPIYRPE